MFRDVFLCPCRLGHRVWHSFKSIFFQGLSRIVIIGSQGVQGWGHRPLGVEDQGHRVPGVSGVRVIVRDRVLKVGFGSRVTYTGDIESATGIEYTVNYRV